MALNSNELAHMPGRTSNCICQAYNSVNTRQFQKAQVRRKASTFSTVPLEGRNTNSPTLHGKIEQVITQDDVAGRTGVTVHASAEDPRYEIRNCNTGKTTGLRESNILRTSDPVVESIESTQYGRER
ncbi:hypothetical protein L211DRAFT_899891 [Terfezia boudieri ATCC MYA-4762]|uniref:Hypervirulence associated protein TUDOR domain-containing protein n=1 Tax=Terfezia boudieri ATCC MYA-4762 TaxID=1051890 RepID=A0A3N4M0Q0_9PEZI|nr:hypothetical protein L211DRAFT_899891 [Terfezia boudieri ATCC MYA-4762]